MKPIRAALPALLLIAACSSSPEGHIIGQKETLRDPTTGEQFEQVTYFTPRRDESGVIIGYEEPLPPGYVLRDLQGRRAVIVNPPERQ